LLRNPERYPEAERDLEHAVNNYPDFRPARLNRGAIYLLQGKQSAALEDFEAILQEPADKQLIEAAYYRGQVYLQRGDLAQALKDFARVAAEKPGFRPVFLSRAQVHFLQGKDAEAVKDLDAFLAGGLPFDARSQDACERRG